MMGCVITFTLDMLLQCAMAWRSLMCLFLSDVQYEESMVKLLAIRGLVKAHIFVQSWHMVEGFTF